MSRSRILGTGHFLPDKIVTNFDVEKMMDNLLVLYAYNHGYVEAIAAAAPPELEGGAGLECAGFLDCAWEKASLESYERFTPALKKLASPPDERWEQAYALLGLNPADLMSMQHVGEA